MKKLFVTAFVAISIFVFTGSGALAQNQQAALPPAGFTPESPFYFLDRFGEAIQGFFTFNPETRVRLQVAFIAERTSEVKVMLEREKINQGAVKTAFERIRGHRTDLSERIGVIDIQEKEVFVADIMSAIDSLEDIFDAILTEAGEKLAEAIELEKQNIERKLNEPAFLTAMESAFREIAEKIDREIGRPLEGFVVVQDSWNVDVDDDTYSATYRAEAPNLVDLTALRDRILSDGVADNWESGDVVLDDDSLDITFEKTYDAVIIDGITLFPEASVTISATQNSPQAGITAINYDIDITLEGESEHLSDFLEEQEEELGDDANDLTDELEEQMEPQKAAERAIAEAEEGKQELLDEAVEKDMVLPVTIFAEFDGLLAQAKSALATLNFQEARFLAKQAEKSLDDIEKTIENLEKAKEKEEELKKEQEEKAREAQEIQKAQMKKEVEKEAAQLEKKLEKAEEETRKAEEELREAEERAELVLSPMGKIAKGARIKADMLQIRALAELVYSAEGSYNMLSCAYPEVVFLCQNIADESGKEPIIHSTQKDYCVYVKLPLENYYCIDSMGASREASAYPGKTGYCDGITFVCP